MELYKNTANAFAEYLYRHGYPKESVAFEWGDKAQAVDIAILDLDINMPVSIYEIKGQKNAESFKRAIDLLKSFASKYSYPINYGVIFSKEVAPFFEFIDVTEYVKGIKVAPVGDALKHLLFFSDQNEPVSYKSRSQSVKSSIISERQAKKAGFGKAIKVISWIVLPVIIMAVILLDAFTNYKITTERLIVYGIGILIVFIPFIREVKWGDYSLSLSNSKNVEEKVGGQ